MSRSLWVVRCCAALMPCAALAQSVPAHDLSSMPGMEMPVAKPAAPVKRGPVAKVDHAAMHAGSAATQPTPAVPRDPPAMDPASLSHDGSTQPAAAHGGQVVAPSGDAAPIPTSPTMDTEASMTMLPDGEAPPDARDPDAYADGLPREPMHGMDMDDDAKHLYVLVDRLEAVHTRDAHGQAIDAQAWYGGDLDKLWLKVDGEREGGRLGATRTEALWNHAIASYWSVQGGVRQDFGGGPGRTWAALGVQGLAPYWFDVQATAYVGEGGRTALRFETEYDLLLTQRWIVQPDVKIDVHGRDDARRGIGAGVTQAEAGLRLRHDVTRKFAPYVGVVWNRTFGNTARATRAADSPVLKIEAVAGIRFWF